MFAFQLTIYDDGCFPATLPTECEVILFNFCQSDRCEMVLKYCFNLHFSNYEGVRAFIFLVPYIVDYIYIYMCIHI